MRPEGKELYCCGGDCFCESPSFCQDNEDVKRGEFYTDSELAALIADVKREAGEEYRAELLGMTGEGCGKYYRYTQEYSEVSGGMVGVERKCEGDNICPDCLAALRIQVKTARREALEENRLCPDGHTCYRYLGAKGEG